MIPLSPGDCKKEAIRLFEDGRYRESLEHCEFLLETERDPSVEILSATNLFSCGRLEDAEVAFRDLARKMPDSSYVHSYLAKVLEARGDEAAITEYATAVRLDPDNQDALRSYGEYLTGRKDFNGALPVVKRIALIGSRMDDVQNQVRILSELGRFEEALAVSSSAGGELTRSPEYLDALIGAGRFAEAALAAQVICRETREPRILRKYLSALAKYDPGKALWEYSSLALSPPDPGIQLDHVLLLRSSGKTGDALDAVRVLLSVTTDPAYRLIECQLLAESGDVSSALAAYERLVAEELSSKNDMDLLGRIIGSYREFLQGCVPADVAAKRFTGFVSQDVNVVSLVETGRFFEAAGDAGEARSWYYRAYRADFLDGGLPYAEFLSNSGDFRECEKVMLYILANAKKGADVTRVAGVVVSSERMWRLKRLMDQLIKKLPDQRLTLGSEGLLNLAWAFIIVAQNALDESEYAECKYYCLCGLDVLPSHASALIGDRFLPLIRACKEESIADRPIMHAPARAMTRMAAAVPPAKAIADQLQLSEPEQKILAFLRTHRKATEMELRKLLGTRRVAGIVNGLVRKAAAQGLVLVAKQGMGEDGEVYEYTGS